MATNQQPSISPATLRQSALTGLALLSFFGFYLWVHPDYFGDAVWYAHDIRSSRLPIDSGHLLWRKLAAIIVASSALDPLLALQLLCAFGSASLVLITFYLAGALGLARYQALFAAGLVGFSNFTLSYGASGSSYAPALAACLLAFVLAIRSQMKARFGLLILSCFCFAFSWSLWGLTPLLLPSFCLIPILFSQERLTLRCARAVFIGLFVSFLVSIVLLVCFLLFVDENSTLLEWLNSSGHGIALTLSPMSLARAALGLYSCFFVSTGFGTEIKGLLLGESAQRGANFILNLSCFAFFGLAFLLLIGQLLIRIRKNKRSSSAPAYLALAAFCPVLLFAALWQGSDIERFCLAMPFIAIAFSSTLQAIRIRAIIVLWLTIYCALNIFQITCPELFGRENLIGKFISATQTYTQPGDSLIVNGQRIGHSTWAPIEYFSGTRVFSVLYDVQTKDPEKWNERLHDFVEQGLRTGNVFVLADLIDRDSLKGIGILETEYPKPSIAELREFFAKFKSSYAWQVEDLVFLKITNHDS